MSRSTDPLYNSIAIVTGGAGGIGSAICHAVAEAGASVIVGYHRSREAAEQLSGELRGGGKHMALRASVCDSASLTELSATVEREYGRCDLLVNCAGTTRFVAHGDLDGLSDTLVDEILATNVRGPFATVRAVRNLLAKSPDALIVNISSVAAVTAMGSNIIYCASKAALDNMTKSLARALAPTIRVLSISPGLVDTHFIEEMDPAFRTEQIARTPLSRLARPGEVGRAVVAAFEGLPYSTGAVIPVDGGRPLA